MAKDTDKGQTRSGGNVPGPDVMLGTVGVLDGPDGRARSGLGRPGQAVVADDHRRPRARRARRRGEAARRGPAQGPDAPLHRPDVERKSPARGRADRLGRDRAGLAHGLAALAPQARDRQGHRGFQHGTVALGAPGLARSRAALAGPCRHARRRKGRCPPRPTSGSPRPSGTRTPSIAPSRRSISSRRTG